MFCKVISAPYYCLRILSSKPYFNMDPAIVILAAQRCYLPIMSLQS